MPEKSLTETVLLYYRLIDENNTQEMFDLFSENIAYSRCGKTMHNLDEFKKFYLEERDIAGNHTIDFKHIINEGNTVSVNGKFKGKRKSDNANLEFSFSDLFKFNEHGKICQRITLTDGIIV